MFRMQQPKAGDSACVGSQHPVPLHYGWNASSTRRKLNVISFLPPPFPSLFPLFFSLCFTLCVLRMCSATEQYIPSLICPLSLKLFQLCTPQKTKHLPVSQAISYTHVSNYILSLIQQQFPNVLGFPKFHGSQED